MLYAEPSTPNSDLSIVQNQGMKRNKKIYDCAARDPLKDCVVVESLRMGIMWALSLVNRAFKRLLHKKCSLDY